MTKGKPAVSVEELSQGEAEDSETWAGKAKKEEELEGEEGRTWTAYHSRCRLRSVKRCPSSLRNASVYVHSLIPALTNSAAQSFGQ